MLHFESKLILITGAARGIGKAIAAEYGRRGARVIITDILEDELKQTAKELKDAGIKTYSYTCELTDDESVENLKLKVLRDAGVPDILHNNAYYARHGSIFDAKPGDIAKAFDVSVLGYIRIIQAFLPEMTARRSGHIINTASPIGITPPPLMVGNMMAYAITKAGDISLSQSLAVALEPFNIGVTVLYPDVVRTEALEATRGTGDPHFERKLDVFFDAKATTPEEFAPLILDEVSKGEFIANRYEPFKDMLVAYARNGMDPRADYAHGDWEALGTKSK